LTEWWKNLNSSWSTFKSLRAALTKLLYLPIDIEFMRLLLTKILISIVLGCFVPSATETDIGHCHQTFFDDYDTYIASPQQDLETPDHQLFLQKTGLPLFNHFPDLLPAFPYQGGYGCFTKISRHLSLQKRKIFLENSSLLI